MKKSDLLEESYKKYMESGGALINPLEIKLQAKYTYIMHRVEHHYLFYQYNIEGLDTLEKIYKFYEKKYEEE